MQRLARLPSALVALAAGSAWYFAGTRIAWRLGVEEAASAVGALLGIAIALTLWRRTMDEELERSLHRLVCPTCGGALATMHEHASERHPQGLQEWTCPQCGYARALPLTCDDCAQ